jgi:signal recognition particle GTPase
VKSPAERQEEARRKKLDEIQEQVDKGGLVIREMTDEEKKKFPPKERDPSRGKRRGGGSSR